MNYDLLVFYLFCSAVVVMAVVVSYRLKKNYPMPYLTYHFYFILSMGFFFLFTRPIRHLLVSVMELDPQQQMQVTLVLFLLVLKPLYILALYLLAKYVAALVGEKPGRGFVVIFFLFFGSMYGAGLYGMIVLFESGAFSPASQVLLFIIADASSAGYLLGCYAYLVFKGSRMTDAAVGRSVRNLGHLYFWGLVFFNIISIYIHGLFQDFLFYLVLLPPMVYLYRFVTRYCREHSPVSGQKDVLAEVYLKYNISPREQEIIGYICAGKGNREISDVLYISLQTVKHHIHSVYRKLKIKNRVQLTNFIRNAAGDK